MKTKNNIIWIYGLAYLLVVGLYATSQLSSDLKQKKASTEENTYSESNGKESKYHLRFFKPL